MARRMSVALTLDAVRARTKTVTRRHIGTWRNLHAGDELDLIEKGMGLPRGASQVVVCRVRIVSVRDELLLDGLNDDELAREGFEPADWSIEAWANWWALGLGYKPSDDLGSVWCRRIEWEYLDA